MDYSNEAIVVGKVVTDPEFAYELAFENYYKFWIRKPGRKDINIEIVAKEKLASKIKWGDIIEVQGTLRSYLMDSEDKELYVYAFAISPVYNLYEMNYVYLDGVLLSDPETSINAQKRPVTRIKFAVPRLYGSDDDFEGFIMDERAEFAATLRKGCEILLSGSLRDSDIYVKRLGAQI